MKSLSEAYASYIVSTILNKILQEVIDEVGVNNLKARAISLTSNERKANEE